MLSRSISSSGKGLAIAPLAMPKPPRRSVVLTRAQPSIAEKLGGKEALNAAVDLFYKKVLADDRVNSYFATTDMKKQRGKQVAFLLFALGGSKEWRGRDMYTAHKDLMPKLKEEHFAAVAENLIATLNELGIPQETIDEAIGVVASTHDDVLGIGH